MVGGPHFGGGLPSLRTPPFPPPFHPFLGRIPPDLGHAPQEGEGGVVPLIGGGGGPVNLGGGSGGVAPPPNYSLSRAGTQM